MIVSQIPVIVGTQIVQEVLLEEEIRSWEDMPTVVDEWSSLEAWIDFAISEHV